MEHIVTLHIEKLPEGVYLATSDDIQGLVAQGRTIQETLEIARDVAKKLLEARSVADEATAGRLPEACERFDYPLVVPTYRLLDNAERERIPWPRGQRSAPQAHEIRGHDAADRRDGRGRVGHRSDLAGARERSSSATLSTCTAPGSGRWAASMAAAAALAGRKPTRPPYRWSDEARQSKRKPPA